MGREVEGGESFGEGQIGEREMGRGSGGVRERERKVDTEGK